MRACEREIVCASERDVNANVCPRRCPCQLPPLLLPKKATPTHFTGRAVASAAAAAASAAASASASAVNDNVIMETTSLLTLLDLLSFFGYGFCFPFLFLFFSFGFFFVFVSPLYFLYLPPVDWVFSISSCCERLRFNFVHFFSLIFVVVLFCCCCIFYILVA